MSENEKHAMQSWPLKRLEFPMPIRYHLDGEGDGVAICLHGYQDHALSMVRRLGWWETALPFRRLAINGPFPVPIWTGDGFKEAYSWYFRDTTRQLNFVPPETTADRLKLLLDDLKLGDAPKVLVGFSMGGFLSPYVAAVTKNVRGIIGIGCGYNADAYARCRPLAVHAVHGDKDERISIASARTDFEKLATFGHNGQFHVIPGLTHRVESSIEPLVRRLTLECLKGSK
jgi:predicted esterase